MEELRVLCIGDIRGRPGRRAVRELLPRLVGQHAPDIVIANGENSSGGFGITAETAEDLKKLHIDVITSGNHIWDKKDIYDYIRTERRLLRPANFPQGTPRKAWGARRGPTDGPASAVIGPHPHEQTSDERVLPGGTAFITDAGMTGPMDSVIGMKKEIILEKFLAQMPVRFDVATKGVELQGVVVTIGRDDGRATKIERIKMPLGAGC